MSLPLRRLKQPQGGHGVIAVQLAITNGVPILHLPPGLGADEERFVAEWVDATRPNIEQIATEVSRILGQRAARQVGI